MKILKRESLKKLILPLILVLLGAVILLIPAKTEEPKPVSIEPDSAEIRSQVESDESRLEKILQCVSGAGKVRVMLTTKNTGTVEYQENIRKTSGNGEEEQLSETVFYADGSSREKPLIRSENAPQYLGALIVCQGGEDPKTCLELTNAVCALMGLTSDKVTILKMKN